MATDPDLSGRLDSIRVKMEECQQAVALFEKEVAEKGESKTTRPPVQRGTGSLSVVARRLARAAEEGMIAEGYKCIENARDRTQIPSGDAGAVVLQELGEVREAVEGWSAWSEKLKGLLKRRSAHG